ncbi:SMR family transporter [Microbacterium sp. X-17]|uniref:DMT family transporter n=1 Tax=Microbacterium sp. X-17 TaxID=3144404 RepID=UPI0031F5363F
MKWVLLAGAILSEVGATLALRASEGFRKRIWIVPVGAGYLLSFVLLYLCLGQGMPIGVAYGIWSAVGVALTAVLARILFQEPFTWTMALGIVAIAIGVFLIEVGAAR